MGIGISVGGAPQAGRESSPCGQCDTLVAYARTVVQVENGLSVRVVNAYAAAAAHGCRDDSKNWTGFGSSRTTVAPASYGGPHQAHQGLAVGKGVSAGASGDVPPPPVCSLQPLRCPAMRWGGARGIP
jgi:hypothetical protein